jgi:hypothetical protein
MYAKDTKHKEENLTNTAIEKHAYNNKETDPLMYRGITEKEEMTKTFMNTKTFIEDTEMHNITVKEAKLGQTIDEFIQTFQEINKQIDKEVLHTFQETNKQKKEESVNTIQKMEEDEREEHPRWIPYIRVKVPNYGEVSCMIDTGANPNIINIELLQAIAGEDYENQLRPTNVILRVGDDKRTVVMGKVRLTFTIEGRKFTETFVVMERSNFDILLGSA